MNLRTKLSFIKGLITKRSPIYVQLAVSKNCNLRCLMCKAVESRKDESELSLEQIGKLAKVLKSMGVGIIVLTGGEPLMRKDLPDVVRQFSSLGLEVRLQTNGLLATEEKIKALLEAGVREVTLSLDTLDAKKQDAINNQDGSWDKTIRALALFSRLLPKIGNMTGVNTVVSRLNISEIPGIIKFVSALGFYSSLIPVHLTQSESADFIVRAEGDEFRFHKEDHALIDTVYASVVRMKKQGYNVHNSTRFLKLSPVFLKYGRVNWACDSPNLYFSISPQGYFLPCVDLKGQKSMLDDDFLEVFASAEFKKSVRRQVTTCPGCFYACYPEVSFFCRNPLTTLERIIQGYRISQTARIPLSYEDSLELARKIKENSDLL